VVEEEPVEDDDSVELDACDDVDRLAAVVACDCCCCLLSEGDS
jgi:hypothetical protein